MIIEAKTYQNSPALETKISSVKGHLRGAIQDRFRYPDAMNSPYKIPVIIAVALALVTTAFIYLLSRSEPVQNKEPVKATTNAPPVPPCDFWKAWTTSIGPSKATSMLTRLKDAVDAEPKYSSGYKAYLSGASPQNSGDTEQVCLQGIIQTGHRHWSHQAGADGCPKSKGALADIHIHAKVVRQESGRYDTSLDIHSGTGDLTAEWFRQASIGQLSLLMKEYSGWQEAFPAFASFNENSLGISVKAEERSPPPSMLLQPKASLLPQKSFDQRSSWSHYLIRLSNLLDIKGALQREDGVPLLNYTFETIRSQFAMSFLAQPNGLVTPNGGDSPNPFAWHNLGLEPKIHVMTIKVHFRGLDVVLDGLRFKVHFHSQPQELGFKAQFAGINKVEVSGNYRNIPMGSLGEFVRNTVRQYIEKELKSLETGRQGQGFHLSLNLSTKQQVSTSQLKILLELPINILPLIQVDAATGEGVLPNAKANQELKEWLSQSLSALIKDSKTCS